MKITQNNKELSQEIYDNIFKNIENSLREMGHGDVTVNKKMKNFNQIFHDLLLKFLDYKTPNKINIKEIIKFLFLLKKNDEISIKLSNYFVKYFNFCFDIINQNMIKDLDKFEY